MAFGAIVQGPVSQASLIQVVGSGTAVTATFDSAVTAGNLIVVVHFTGATDSQAYAGMTEAVAVTDGTNADQGAIYFRVVQGGDGTTWGANSGGADEHGMLMWEIEGPFAASPLDVTAVNAGNPVTDPGTSFSTGTTATTAQNDEVAFAIVTSRNVFVDVSAWSNSFTGTLKAGMANKVVVGGFKVLTATGTVETTATLTLGTGGGCMAGIATFKKAGAGGIPETGVEGMEISDSVSYSVVLSPSTCRIVSTL